jgi:hypothetical protein
MWKSAPLLVLVLAAGCGKPLNATMTGLSPQPLDATMRCVAATADSLGYKPKLVNHNKGVEAVHKDSVLAPYEDGRIEKITASGANSKSNDGSSSLTVVSATFSQHWTRIGLESDEIPASEKVKADGKTVMAKCGGASN